ncbi:hypothetical protein SAMD00019534_101950 [Acytostelium subglobosum LB1]|uniref:hypothetical protein n=1 Tax=Acytostelium subglobosum LB1 TaxID=1410327 RepID=UPI000644FB07|nr:hypothetical protein SAMD00019534_101950 [Acytostelium subglobosum LB1]GAM27020.1 hypothetical protein SAMD00019534_101950 [Acytostelium subglobosum LB1]|eukprot:XP_012749900.1 hypothetical protein SAMD00019534_101950 [Acytostelium subglobosum LB1]
MKAIKAFFKPTTSPKHTSGQNVAADLCDLTLDESTYHSAKQQEPSYSLFFSRLDSKRVQPFVGLKGNNTAIHLGNKFQLTSLQIDAVVNDASVTTVYTQKYRNGFTEPVEAKYEMPLAPNAAVSNFVVTYNDKVLVAQIKEKAQAQNEYSDAIASGNQAFMVEKNSSGSFTTLIGNLPPTDEVTVSLTVVSEIGTHLDRLHFCLHRFMFIQTPFDLVLKLDVQLSVPIESITFKDHSTGVDTTVDGHNGKLTYTTSEGVPKNIIVDIKPQPVAQPSYFLEKGPTDDTYALGLNFYPRLHVTPDEVDQAAEYIFLVDCSGSMSGSVIEQAKLALEILMRSLTERSKFNIWLFGSDFVSLFPESKLYNDETLDQASKYIVGIDANLGGTELLPPMKAILGNPYDPQYPRQVFILTDGEVSQRDELVDFVGKEANTTRIFTFGIGGGVDRELIVGMSRACKGYYEFIQDESDMEERVMTLMNVALEPTVSNIKVDWHGLDVLQAPKLIRPVFNLERMLIYALINKKPSKSSVTITITADGPTGKELAYPIEVHFDTAQTTSNKLHTLTALMAIRDYEEEERKGSHTKNKDKIVALGLKYHLVSNHTSFVVVAENTSGKPVEDTLKVVNVKQPEPIEQEEDVNTTFNAPTMFLSQQVQGFTSIPSVSATMCAPPSPSILRSGSPRKRTTSNNVSQILSAPVQLDMCEGEALDDCKVSYSMCKSQMYVEEERIIPTVKESNEMMELIRSQKANGSWSSVGSFKVPSVASIAKSLPADVWITLCVICKLESSFADKKAQWQAIVTKAIKWIKQQLTKASMADKYDQLHEAATKAL